MLLQYITSAKCGKSILTQAKEVLDGGCRWIQIRMKDSTDDEVREAVKEVKPLCDEYQAFLVLNDRVELAKELGVGGVHIGQEDMSASQARQILGAEPVIGVTCNTFEQIQAVAGLDIDYIGVGPFRTTSTKEKLAPIVGLDGYREIVNKMKEAGIDNIPIVAVGGITLDDVEDLMKTGVNGIAVCADIADAEDSTKRVEDYIEKLETVHSA